MCSPTGISGLCIRTPLLNRQLLVVSTYLGSRGQLTLPHYYRLVFLLLHLEFVMANRGYDVVVDVDAEVIGAVAVLSQEFLLTSSQGDLGHTDLQEDLEFHSSSEPIRYHLGDRYNSS